MCLVCQQVDPVGGLALNKMPFPRARTAMEAELQPTMLAVLGLSGGLYQGVVFYWGEGGQSLKDHLLEAGI